MALVPGESVPRIVADNQHGERIRPDFATPTVLYFYRRSRPSASGSYGNRRFP